MSEVVWHRVCTLNEVPDGGRLGKSVRGQQVLLFRIGNEVLAYEDSCPHAGAPLSDGRVHQGRITCRHHQWQFDIRTGAALRATGKALKPFPLRIEQGDVFLQL
nr:Rieske [2Fe-2S] domain [uncultured organism]